MSTSGVRASYKGKGLDVSFDYNMADMVALSAVGLGAVGTFVPEVASTVVGLGLLGAGLSYFGVKNFKPDLLPTFARDNPSDKDKVLLVAGALGAYYFWKKSQEPKVEVEVLAPAPAPLPPARPLPKVEAPSKEGQVRRAGPVQSTQAIPPGPPSHDSNMPWWPSNQPGNTQKPSDTGYLGQDSWIAWATGAEEGEGYIPDDWWVIGTKQGVKDTASSAVTTAAEAAGKGAGTAVGTATEKALPSWLVPTLALGGLGLAGYWVYKRA